MMDSSDAYPLLLQDIVDVSGHFDASDAVRHLDHTGHELFFSIAKK
jgi:hypothetical protein